jgi:hypothetical protein
MCDAHRGDRPHGMLTFSTIYARAQTAPRVPDIRACYKQWGDKGAYFLTEPLDNHGWECRCYMRDPDDYLIEVRQYTQTALDSFKNHAI